MALLDLIEEGNLGLIHALENSTLTRLSFFYLRYLVDTPEYRAFHHDQSRTIRLPVHIVKDLNVALRAWRHLENPSQRTRNQRAEDVAHLLGLPVEEVRYILGLNERIASLDAPLDIDPSLTNRRIDPGSQSSLPENLLQNAEVNAYCA